MTSTIRNDSTNLFRSSAWNSTAIYQSRISDNLVKWIRVGNTVFVSGRFRTETATNVGTALATGLPGAAGNTSVPLSGTRSDGTAPVAFYVNQNGSLCSGTALATATYYAVGGVYFT